ncbi:unnamed protein product [Caretta caretta]
MAELWRGGTGRQTHPRWGEPVVGADRPSPAEPKVLPAGAAPPFAEELCTGDHSLRAFLTAISRQSPENHFLSDSSFRTCFPCKTELIG